MDRGSPFVFNQQDVTRQAGCRLLSQTLGIAGIECVRLPAAEEARSAEGPALREALGLFCLGLSVRWRPAYRSWFARHWPAVRVHAPCLRSTSCAFSRPPRRQSRVPVFSAVSGLRKAGSSIRVVRCVRVIHRPRAGAPGQAAQAVQPPASLVALASVCLQAASPNAQCMQALCRLARCLTIQSTGRAPASWVTPVISNVERLLSSFHVGSRFAALVPPSSLLSPSAAHHALV